MNRRSARSLAPFGLRLKSAGLALLVAASSVLCVPGAVGAQSSAESQDGVRVGVPRVTLESPSDGAALNGRIEGGVRRAIGVFPGDRFHRFALSRAMQAPGVAALDFDAAVAEAAGLDIVVKVRRQDGSTPPTTAFPVMVDADGRCRRVKVEGLVFTTASSMRGMGGRN